MLSISHTTRSPRQGEVDGVNYFFRTKEEFQKSIEENAFLEWAQYSDNFYGTKRKFVERKLNEGFDLILEIDTQGALKVKEQMPDAILIFILPYYIIFPAKYKSGTQKKSFFSGIVSFHT